MSGAADMLTEEDKIVAALAGALDRLMDRTGTKERNPSLAIVLNGFAAAYANGNNALAVRNARVLCDLINDRDTIV